MNAQCIKRQQHLHTEDCQCQVLCTAWSRVTYQCKLLCSSGPVRGLPDSLNSGHSLEVSNAAEGSDQEGEGGHPTGSKQLQPKLLDIVTSQRDRFRTR